MLAAKSYLFELLHFLLLLNNLSVIDRSIETVVAALGQLISKALDLALHRIDLRVQLALLASNCSLLRESHGFEHLQIELRNRSCKSNVTEHALSDHVTGQHRLQTILDGLSSTVVDGVEIRMEQENVNRREAVTQMEHSAQTQAAV